MLLFQALLFAVTFPEGSMTAVTRRNAYDAGETLLISCLFDSFTGSTDKGLVIYATSGASHLTLQFCAFQSCSSSETSSLVYTACSTNISKCTYDSCTTHAQTVLCATITDCGASATSDSRVVSIDAVTVMNCTTLVDLLYFNFFTNYVNCLNITKSTSTSYGAGPLLYTDGEYNGKYIYMVACYNYQNRPIYGYNCISESLVFKYLILDSLTTAATTNTLLYATKANMMYISYGYFLNLPSTGFYSSSVAGGFLSLSNCYFTATESYVADSIGGNNAITTTACHFSQSYTSLSPACPFLPTNKFTSPGLWLALPTIVMLTNVILV